MISGKPEPTVLDDAWALVNEPVAPAPAEAAPGEGPSPRLRRPPPPPDVDHTVGVVFVHGIGSQVAGETIFDWSAPLVRTLWAWAEATADPEHGRPFTDPVEWADVDLTGQSTPVLQVVIPEMDGHQRQRWVMTEAWWAADVRPPSLSTMLDWLVGKGEVKHIGAGIINGLRITADRRRDDITAPGSGLPAGDPAVADSWTSSTRSPSRCLFGLLALVIVPIYSVLRVLGSLPIPGLKDAVSTTQIDLFLTNWFGDVRILLADRAQAANLRTQMATAILKLRAYGVDSVVVVAHSGGTVLSYMLLADPFYDDLDIDKFITHGQALGMAWTLGHLEDEVRPDYDDGLRAGDRLMRLAHHPRPDGTAVDASLGRFPRQPRSGAGLHRVRLAEGPAGRRRPARPGRQARPELDRVQPDERAQRPRRLLGQRRAVRDPAPARARYARPARTWRRGSTRTATPIASEWSAAPAASAASPGGGTRG